MMKRFNKHKPNLRKKGLRLIEIWVPDTRRKEFAEECQRQSRLLRKDPHETETLQWLDETAARDGWTL